MWLCVCPHVHATFCFGLLYADYVLCIRAHSFTCFCSSGPTMQMYVQLDTLSSCWSNLWMNCENSLDSTRFINKLYHTAGHSNFSGYRNPLTPKAKAHQMWESRMVETSRLASWGTSSALCCSGVLVQGQPRSEDLVPWLPEVGYRGPHKDTVYPLCRERRALTSWFWRTCHAW